jgi:enoyl-CoA hydratase
MKFIDLETFDGIRIVKISRPDAMNALNSKVLKEIDMVIDNIKVNGLVKAVVLTGEGKAFVAGADIGEMQHKDTIRAREFAQLGMDVLRKLELLNKPIIAAVNGFALGGGCELAMACDFIIAGDKAKFGQPEVSLGITPGFGGTQRLTRHVGRNMAKELIYTGRIIDANKAKEIGLVNEVVNNKDLMKKVLQVAREITRNSSTAVGYSKSAMNRGMEADIDTGLSIEKDMFGLCFATEDQIEGMKAFMDKREPNFI